MNSPSVFVFQTEDCLILNIFSPQPIGATSLLPVLVWIHGGTYMFGSSNMPMYHGKDLSKHLNAVVVTVNYRIGNITSLFVAYTSLALTDPISS